MIHFLETKYPEFFYLRLILSFTSVVSIIQSCVHTHINLTDLQTFLNQTKEAFNDETDYYYYYVIEKLIFLIFSKFCTQLVKSHDIVTFYKSFLHLQTNNWHKIKNTIQGDKNRQYREFEGVLLHLKSQFLAFSLQYLPLDWYISFAYWPWSTFDNSGQRRNSLQKIFRTQYDILKRLSNNELAEHLNIEDDFTKELDFIILENGMKTPQELLLKEDLQIYCFQSLSTGGLNVDHGQYSHEMYQSSERCCEVNTKKCFFK